MIQEMRCQNREMTVVMMIETRMNKSLAQRYVLFLLRQILFTHLRVYWY